jgi:hypothetical protein
MAASLKDKRTPITTPPYQVPSVDVTPDPPIFSLVTTFKCRFVEAFRQFLQNNNKHNNFFVLRLISIIQCFQNSINFVLQSHTAAGSSYVVLFLKQKKNFHRIAQK